MHWHVAHSMQCCEQLQIRAKQAQQRAPGDEDQDMEYNVEDHWKVNNLPNEDHALEEHEDIHEPAEECEDIHERQHMEDEHEKGDEAFFSCFA